MEKSLQAISAVNRDVTDTQVCEQQDCREYVHIALFFDETGSNRFTATKTRARQTQNLQRQGLST